MRFPHSIRWRLQIWHGLILLAVLGGFGFTAWKLEQQRVLKGLEERLFDRHQQVTRLLRDTRPPRDDGPRPPGEPGRREGGPRESARSNLAAIRSEWSSIDCP